MPAIHLLILVLYKCAHVAYSYYLSLRTFPICFFPSSFFSSCLLFYLLPSRILTRSVSRPEVVGATGPGFSLFLLMFTVFLVKDACLFCSCWFSFSLVMR